MFMTMCENCNSNSNT